MFEHVTYMLALSIMACIAIALIRYRDPFHPVLYLGVMVLFLYAFLPLYLAYTQHAALTAFLGEDALTYVQVLNWVGALSLCVGAMVGSGRALPWHKWSGGGLNLSLPVRRRLFQSAMLLGLVGVVSYLWQIWNVGGFDLAYGTRYGGGWSEHGYLREAMLLTVPAVLLLMVAHVGRRMSLFDWALIAVFAMPLLLQGLLGARRGPTFVVLVALGAGWYMMRMRHPRMTVLLAAGLALAFLILSLLANRDTIHLGSDYALQRGVSESYLFHAGSGNEFVYGAAAILHADALERYWWGSRYAVVLFVRPIPSALWPTKYEDAAATLGAPDLRAGNMGTGGFEFTHTLGWAGAVGAAPGIVADMWIEFWWLAFPVLFLFGWCYGRAWLLAVRGSGLWLVIYCILMALSIYLIMQTLEAMLFRFLLLAAAVWICWRYATAGARAQARVARPRPSGLRSYVK